MALTCTNVTLRQRVISNGRISLYLDYYPAIRNPYTMKMSRREYLGIYIYARPKMRLNVISTMKCWVRLKPFVVSEYRQSLMRNLDFLISTKWKLTSLPIFVRKQTEVSQMGLRLPAFWKFVNGYCTFGDVTVELCQKFRQYLLNCKQIRHPNISVSRNSAAGYFQLSVHYWK